MKTRPRVDDLTHEDRNRLFKSRRIARAVLRVQRYFTSDTDVVSAYNWVDEMSEPEFWALTQKAYQWYAPWLNPTRSTTNETRNAVLTYFAHRHMVRTIREKRSEQ